MKGQKYPVIPTTPSIFMRLDSFLRGLSKNFREMSASLQAFLDEQNLKAIKASLHNIEMITDNMAKNNQRFTQIMKNTERTTLQLTPVLESLQTQTLPNISRLLINLDSVSRNLNDITDEIKQNPSILIRGSSPPPLGPGETR